MQKVEGLILALYYYKLYLSTFPYGTVSITPKVKISISYTFIKGKCFVWLIFF